MMEGRLGILCMGSLNELYYSSMVMSPNFRALDYVSNSTFTQACQLARQHSGELEARQALSLAAALVA